MLFLAPRAVLIPFLISYLHALNPRLLQTSAIMLLSSISILGSISNHPRPNWDANSVRTVVSRSPYSVYYRLVLSGSLTTTWYSTCPLLICGAVAAGRRQLIPSSRWFLCRGPKPDEDFEQDLRSLVTWSLSVIENCMVHVTRLVYNHVRPYQVKRYNEPGNKVLPSVNINVSDSGGMWLTVPPKTTFLPPNITPRALWRI